MLKCEDGILIVSQFYLNLLSLYFIISNFFASMMFLKCFDRVATIFTIFRYPWNGIFSDDLADDYASGNL